MSLIGLAFPWILSNLFYIYNLVVTRFDEAKGKCRILTFRSLLEARAVGITGFFLQYALPLTVMIVCYVKMAHVLARKHERTDGSHADRKWGKAKINVIKTLVSVCVAFILCWSWNQLFFLMYNVGVKVRFDNSFYVFSVVAAHVNCAINPLIYAAKYTEFKLAFVQMLRRGKVGPVTSSGSTTTNTSNLTTASSQNN